ncbi:MAG: restriction endonuclease, SacI family, partial [Promethearchaeota archaeon]
KKLYNAVLQLLDLTEKNNINAENLLKEIVRCLYILNIERKDRLRTLLRELESTEESIPLSSEDVVQIFEHHIGCRGASRLPVLIVAAAYKAASEYLKEKILALHAHNAADRQTGALGDVEITLIDDKKVITSYEMKLKKVVKSDIDNALNKIVTAKVKIDNYIFISTESSDEDVIEYAKSQYSETKGIEFVILDCISFAKHFLHLFHRIRIDYLNAYQELVLSEPESAISQSLKEIFLNLRLEAERQYINDSE